MTYYDYVVLTYWTHFCINTKNEPSLKVHFFVKCQHVKVNQRMSTRESRERSLRQTTFTIFKISKKNYKRDIMQLFSADALMLLEIIPKRPIFGRNRNLKGSPCLLSIYRVNHGKL